MKKWTIGKRVTFGFAVVILIALALGIYASLTLRKIKENSTRITGDCLPGVYMISQIEINAKDNYLNLLKHVIRTNAQEKAQFEALILAATEQNHTAFKEFEATIIDQKDREIFESIKEERAPYLDAAAQVLKFSRDFNSQEAIDRVNNQLHPAYLKYMAQVKAGVNFNKTNADYYGTCIQASVDQAQFGMAVGLALAVLAGSGVGIQIVRRTNRALLTVANVIGEGSLQVSAASSQVSASSQSLAEGASEQAASLEETGSSLEEMASMTKRNAEGAHQANLLAKQASEAADQGSADMQAMKSAMETIKTSSDDVAKIIKAIDEIAFQTNILALNAAVEAARAGEAGMGFAVVAEEVRSLAQRSAQAARETSAKIEGAISRTELGVEMSAKVAQAFQVIVGKVREVDQLVTEVAAASKEQSQGIEQVNLAVNQMDKVTQTTAAQAEETASAAEEMNAQAQVLKEAVEELQSLVGTRQTARSEIPVGAQTSPEARPASPKIRQPAHRAKPPVNGKEKRPASSAEDTLPIHNAGDFKDF